MNGGAAVRLSAFVSTKIIETEMIKTNKIYRKTLIINILQYF
ncbi:hypothetical protein RG47T_2061 [Mucilaginibacter polytrichastri]|uniref:Uncharacterized protein n=1 Tax=Mucilaginibacter polytrichastri TaxID=1302689 RepID=A0A1Q5ZXV7_9SPHI|nr:hypothetical protein RG47T_2061 [Mucilaginibacter polytrichastri]SFS80800.1 hypothetical protein SAMN04487890_104172 [Mucilaginibacter polytrichastri]